MATFDGRTSRVGCHLQEDQTQFQLHQLLRLQLRLLLPLPLLLLQEVVTALYAWTERLTMQCYHVGTDACARSVPPLCGVLLKGRPAVRSAKP